MSDVIEDDDRIDDQHVNGGPISDEDVRAMLAREQKEKRALRQQLEQERTGRTRAEAQATSATTARFDTEEQAVTERLEAADAQALALRKAYSEALSEGRFDEAAEVQDQMAELRARQVADKQYKTWLAGEKTRAAQVVQQQPAHEGVDLSAYSAAQRKWIRANPSFMEDAKVRAKTFAGHQLAVAEGVEVDSPEYFEIIDETVNRGRRRAEEDEEVIPQRRQVASDMPVSRRTPQTSTRQTPVRLSADEMEAADITNPEIPVQGHKDAQGNWVAGRYERYAINREKLRQRNGR